MALYFGDETTTKATIALLILIGYMIILTWKRNDIKHWGRHIVIMDALGLQICCYVAVRDGLVMTIQNAIDGSVAPGLFSLISIQTVAGIIGAGVIIICGLICLFVRKQEMKKKLCFLTIAGILLKIFVIEISRILM